MKPETETHLHLTIKNLAECARLIASKPKGALPNKELIISIGTSWDWLRWAAGLNDLHFVTNSTRNSARGQGVTESVRFMLMWTAANALFAHDPILALMAPNPSKLPKKELERFKLLHKFAAVDPAAEKTCVDLMHNLLSMECATNDVKAYLVAGNPTMWEVIFYKYLRPEDQKCGIGRVIAAALAKKSMPKTDGATIIYGARNWTVHGVLLTSFFRGSHRKYQTFMDAIQLLLAATLHGAAQNLRGRI
jgi:hypothetical protein